MSAGRGACTRRIAASIALTRPCMHACPTHIDVPAFIKKIASGNLMGSARVIFDANPIGATCARVCPVEVLCEGACVEGTLLEKPIEIGRLQRYATDHALSNGRQIYQRGARNRQERRHRWFRTRRAFHVRPISLVSATTSRSTSAAKRPAASTPTAWPSTRCRRASH